MKRKGWVWILYLFSSAVVAFNMYLMTTWDNTNTISQTNNRYASQTTTIMINEQQHNGVTVQGREGQDNINHHHHHPISQQVYPFTVAICVIMKDAENYFEEWLDFHFAMGFDAIYIYDNSVSFELKNWYDNTRNHNTFGKVEVVHWTDDTNQKQNNAYADCVEKFGHSKTGPMNNDYFAFIDVDEFLVIRSPTYNDIQGVLADYLVPYGGALTVNWMFVGSSNKEVSSPLPITKRNQYRAKEAHNVIKSIAKGSDYIEHKGNPHGVNVRSPATIHTTKYPGALFKPSSNTGASDHERPSDILLLYHYRYGSKKEYLYKRCVRGTIATEWCDDGDVINTDDTPDHIQIVPGDVFDDTAWQFLTSRVPKYRAFDEFEDFHHPVVESPTGLSYLRKILKA